MGPFPLWRRFYGVHKMSEREKPEDFEMDSGINWPQFDHMTAEEKTAYYREHPFPYRDLDEYAAAIRRWILWTYEKETEEYVDHCIEKNMRWISAGFRRKMPIDLVAVDIMYCC